jgi:hypothetical protein
VRPMTLRTNRKVSHPTSALAAVASVRGYHAWLILDNFEWAEGYTQRRYLKDSAKWYFRVAATNSHNVVPDLDVAASRGKKRSPDLSLGL